jgi:hypothetical protein
VGQNRQEAAVGVNIEQIDVGFRYRKELGDLRTLTESIAEVGLLHPVVVTPEGRLIAGFGGSKRVGRLGGKTFRSRSSICFRPFVVRRTKTLSAKTCCLPKSSRLNGP